MTPARTISILRAGGASGPPGPPETPPPNVTVSGVTVGGILVSHNTAAVFGGTIHYPTTDPDYASLNRVEVLFRHPGDPDWTLIARLGKPVSPATSLDFSGLWDDRILLGPAAVPGCTLRFATYGKGGAEGLAPFDVAISLPAIGLSAASGTETKATRWQTKDQRQVHSVVHLTVNGTPGVPFYATVWTNHPTGSPNGERRWHGWFAIDGDTEIPIGEEGSNTELYSPLVDESWSVTVEPGTIDSFVPPGGAAVMGPVDGDGPGDTVARMAAPASGLVVTIEVPAPGPNPFPYDLIEGIVRKWSIGFVKVDSVAAYDAINVFTLTLTAQDLGADGTPIGPEHIYGSPVPIKGELNFGKLEGPYGSEATPARSGPIAGVRLKVYASSRADQTTSAWMDPAVSTLEATLDVTVAVGAAVPDPAGAPDDVTPGTPVVRYQNQKAYIAIPYLPPTSLAGFDRVHVYLYAPDTVTDQPATIEVDGGGFIIPETSADAADAGYLPSSVGGPADKGSYPYDPANPIVQFEHPAPPVGKLEHWRAVLVSGGPTVTEKSISDSPFVLFDVQMPVAGGGEGLGTVGAEYGPNYRNGSGEWYEDNATLDGQMLPTWWFELKWELPTEDPRWDRVVGWQLWCYDPLKANDPSRLLNHGYARVASLEKEATSFVLTGRWNLTQTDNEVKFYLVPEDVDGHTNTFVKNINDIATFTVSTVRGLQMQFADGSTIDGIDFEVDPDTNRFRIKNLDLNKVYGPSISAEFKIEDNKFQWGSNLDWKKFDPAKLGAPFDLNATTGFLDFPFNSAEFQTSLAGAKSFNIKALKESLFGNTEFQAGADNKIQIKNVDFSKAMPGTFSPEFSKGAGNIFQVEKLAADKIKTGILEVGGAISGGERVSRFKVFDVATPTPNLIGWVGDDRDASGYIGAWFKRILIGGSSPADAVTNGIYADANGNITANCIFTGTLAANVVYAGYVAAEKISAGSLITGVILTSKIAADQMNAGTLAANVIYAGDLNAIQIKTGTLSVGGPGQAGNILIYNASGANLGWIGSYSSWDGAWFKRVMIGGSDPSTAKIVADAFGVVAVQAAVVQGTLTAANIDAIKVNAGLLSGHTLSVTTGTPSGNITTSVQIQGGNTPVPNTYVGLRISDASGNWCGMSNLGVGAFNNSKFSILFADAVQCYDVINASAGTNTVTVRLGSGPTGPELQLGGQRVVRTRYPSTPSDVATIVACLQHHGLC